MPYSQLSGIIREQIKRKKPRMQEIGRRTGESNEGLTFSVKSDLQESFNQFRLRALIMFDQPVAKEYLSLVVDESQQTMEEVLKPIETTGGLLHSFHYRVLTVNRQVVIWSDKHSASAIEYGFHVGGTIKKLMAWMEEKPKFSFLKPTEKKQVAFLIWQHIESGDEPGPMSTLRGLPPAGKRQYQFMEAFAKKMEYRIELMLNEIAQAGDGV